MSYDYLRKQYDLLVAEWDRHTKAVSEIMGNPEPAVQKPPKPGRKEYLRKYAWARRIAASKLEELVQPERGDMMKELVNVAPEVGQEGGPHTALAQAIIARY